jgi:hypothetical protein
MGLLLFRSRKMVALNDRTIPHECCGEHSACQPMAGDAWVHVQRLQHRTKPELFCAVPVDQPVPAFVMWEQWAFNRSLHPSDPCPSGFRPQAAQDGARFNGFYLFQVTGQHPIQKLSRPQERGRLRSGDQDQTDLAVREHVKTILRKLIIV